MDAAPLQKIRWCSSKDSASELARFFVENVSISYISHAEIQMGRARSLSEWHPDLPSILEKEFQQILEGENPAEGPLRIFTLEEKASLLAMGLVRLEPQKQYAVLEDLVVNRHVRGKKLGSKMVLWLFEQARPLGLKRIFLESGVHNQTAHDFFETLGFRPCSTVFAKDVDPC